MSIYTKSKTTISSVDVVKNRVVDESTSMKVSFNPENVNLIIEYLTNLYADAPVAVIRELFTNACDADPNGFVNVEFIEDHEDNSNIFVITDNGVGMDKQQLTENYVQYANSTKTSEFETVGSFGLGSKSPMAITSEYEVESCDGNKICRAIVQRIESGIYANIDEIGESNESYTKVTVRHISNICIERMKKYLQYLANFSGRQIVLNGEILKRSEGYAFSCKVSSDEDIYDIRIFTPNNSDTGKMNMFANYFKNGGKNFDTIIRVNNTPYTVQRADDKTYGVILIDVEPGFFSFAPSREEIPGGEKKDHILEIANKCVFEDASDIITFISENEYVEDEQIFNSFLDKNIIKDEVAINCLYNTDSSIIEQYKDIWNVRNNTSKAQAKFAKLFEGCHISIYNKTSFRHTRLDSVQEDVGSNKLLEVISNRMYNPIKKFENNIKNLEFVKVYTGMKRNRKGEVKFPKGYGKRTITEQVNDFAESNHLFGKHVCDRYSDWNCATVCTIHILTENDSLSEEALKYLNIINIAENEDGDPFNPEVIVEKFDYEIKATTPQVKIDFEDKVIEYRNTPYPSHNTIRIGDILNKFSPDEYMIITGKNCINYGDLNYLSYKAGKKYISFDYQAKKFLTFLKDSGYDCVDFTWVPADLSNGVHSHYVANNKFTEQFMDYMNCDNTTDYILNNDRALVMGAIANHHNVSEDFFKYLDIEITKIPNNLEHFTRNKINFYNKDKDYNKEFIDSFNVNKYFKDNKKALINNAKANIAADVSYAFKKYFEIDHMNVVKIPKIHDSNPWSKLVNAKVQANKEVSDYKAMVMRFKKLPFYEFGSVISHGLDTNNPIHKAIKENMDKEIAEFFV